MAAGAETFGERFLWPGGIIRNETKGEMERRERAFYSYRWCWNGQGIKEELRGRGFSCSTSSQA
jgi:hypothetical protein